MASWMIDVHGDMENSSAARTTAAERQMMVRRMPDVERVKDLWIRVG
jgi:hypothetical protein